MNDLIRANALLISEDEADTDDIAETEDEEGVRKNDEEDESMDMEADSWQ